MTVPWKSYTGDDWKEKAACRDVDTNIFFPEDFNSVEGRRAVVQARKICGGCPVFPSCVVVGWLQRDGIWFATTPRDRRYLRSSARLRTPIQCANPGCSKPGRWFFPPKKNPNRLTCSQDCAVAKRRVFA